MQVILHYLTNLGEDMKVMIGCIVEVELGACFGVKVVGIYI